jgi:hypothetical protein
MNDEHMKRMAKDEGHAGTEGVKEGQAIET